MLSCYKLLGEVVQSEKPTSLIYIRLQRFAGSSNDQVSFANWKKIRFSKRNPKFIACVFDRLMIASISPKKKCYRSLGKGSLRVIMCLNFHTHAHAQIFGCTTKRPRKKRLPPDWQHDEMAEENSMDIEEGGGGHRRNSGVRAQREAWVYAWEFMHAHVALLCSNIFMLMCRMQLPENKVHMYKCEFIQTTCKHHVHAKKQTKNTRLHIEATRGPKK